MEEAEEELVEVIVRLGAARRLRAKQLREIRLLQDSGKDTSAIEARLLESKRILRQVHLERKELAAKISKKRASAANYEFIRLASRSVRRDKKEA
jgi:hypothetical protein